MIKQTDRASLIRLGLLFVVLLLGAALRFGAVEHGLPRHDLGPDETITAGRVLGDPLHDFASAPTYNWPNLTIHLSRVSISLARKIEARLGRERHDPFVIGRMQTAILGTATLLLLYLAIRRLFDSTTAVVAAAFLAVMPLHVYRSWLWVPDAPMTLFYTLALLFAVGIFGRPTLTRFLLAGCAVGLATASKYNGLGACLPVIIAAWLSRERLPGKHPWGRVLGLLLAAAIASLVAFFAADPLALSHFDQVIRGGTWVSGHYQTEGSTGIFGWYTVRYLAAAFWSTAHEGLGPYLLLLSVAGWAWLVFRRSRPGVLIWLPAVLYLVIFGSLLKTPFERTFLPLLPHLATGAAVLVKTLGDSADRWLEQRQHRVRAGWAVMLVSILVAIPPVASQTHAARTSDTRLQALDWMIENLPTGTNVRHEWDMIAPPSNRFQILKEPTMLCGLGMTVPELAKRFDYVVTSSTSSQWILWQRHRPGLTERAAFYDELCSGSDFELAASFEPNPYAFGSEIRILRSKSLRGPKLTRNRPEADLSQRLWASSDRLREQKETGRFEFARRGDLLAGPVVVKKPGAYELSIQVEPREVFPLELTIGSQSENFEVRTEEVIRLEARLPVGQIWWRVAVGPGHRKRMRAVVSDPKIRRIDETPKGPSPPESAAD